MSQWASPHRWWNSAPHPAMAWVLAAVTLLAFAPAWRAPFFFDDFEAIVANGHLARPWPPSELFSAPAETTAAGRPLVCLTLAFNYAVSGHATWSYHLFNMAVHTVSVLLLWGVLRRTLRGRLPDASVSAAAFTASLLWAIHPLQTEAVNYIVQRTELLMAMWFLLTLYAAIRAWDHERRRIWTWLSIAACAAGMASKEVMVVAPVMVMLYDLCFHGGGLRRRLRQRLGLYAGLMATWLILLLLLLQGARAATTGFGVGVEWHEYGRAQLWALMRYLTLAIWPSHLCVDYGPVTPLEPPQMIMGAAVLLVLVAVGGWAWIARQRWLAFLVAWLLVILAPTTSVIPIVSEVAAERRMHLPLAAVCVAVVLAGRTLLNALGARRRLKATLTAAVVMTLLTLTIRQSLRYNHPEELWADAIATQPNNARAHVGLGDTHYRAGRLQQAITQYRHALTIDANFVDARLNLGYALYALDRRHAAEAAVQLRRVIHQQPRNGIAHYDLALVLSSLKFSDEAVDHARTALELSPRDPQSHAALGTVLAGLNKYDEALPHFQRAVSLAPHNASMHFNVGMLLKVMNRPADAVPALERANRLAPTDEEIAKALSDARQMLGMRR